jgi:mannonate dehydratase
MKIDKISTILTCPDRNYLIVKITSDKGLVGYGDATLNGRELAVQAVIDRHVSGWLEGWDAGAIEKVWQSVVRQQYWRGGAIQMTALSGIDMALWDLKGKELGVPVYSLLGGKSRDRVRVYLHAHGSSDDALVERCRQIMTTGCHAVRFSFETPDPYEPGFVHRQAHQDFGVSKGIEVSRDDLRKPPRWDSQVYARDLVRVAGMLRQQLGRDMDLIHDAHQRLTPIQAAAVGKKLEPFDLLFLEDPVEPMYQNGLRLVRNKTTTPIGMGELYVTLQECLPAIESNLIDFLRLDVSHAGGITGLVKASIVAEAFQVKMAFHGPSDISPLAHAANLHVDTAIVNFGIQEFVSPDPRTLNVFNCGYTYSNGFAVPGDLPGLGVTVDEARASRLPYRESYLPLLQDRDGAVHNW